MAKRASGTRETAGNAIVLLALLLGAAAFGAWQSQDWTWSSHSARWLAAGGLVLGYIGLLAGIASARRRGNAPARVAGAMPVWFASQTGSAERLAHRTATMLRDAGVAADAESMQGLARDELQGTTQALFVVATTGEGDAPDSCARFVRETLGDALPLSNLRYGVLALGDRDYANFCGFGHRLDAWLRQQGAQPLFDLVEVDDGDEGALRHWQHHVAQLSGAVEMPDWSPPAYEAWTLRDRRLLNPGSAGGPVFHVELAPASIADWRAGDIAEIGPRHSIETVRGFLTAAGLHFDEALADTLSRSHLPDPAQPFDATQLSPLPHREYSIASIPQDGALWLLVRQLRRPDGTLGLGAGWLTEHAPIGARIDVRLRANAAFRLPDDDRPLVLIGNGSGMAGLRALLRERIERGRHRNWLLFGERHAACDAFHGEEIAAWLAAGKLARVDYAWSRDGAQRVYVQDRVRENGAELRRWVADGASIHVCGSLQGMAPGVDAALREVLGGTVVDAMLDDGRYRRDVY